MTLDEMRRRLRDGEFVIDDGTTDAICAALDELERLRVDYATLCRAQLTADASPPSYPAQAEEDRRIRLVLYAEKLAMLDAQPETTEKPRP
jgi:hypothetical protein